MFVALWMLVYIYIVKLERLGCGCSQDWKRVYIKYYAYIMAIALSIRIFMKFPEEASILALVCSIFFVMVTYHYIHDL